MNTQTVHPPEMVRGGRPVDWLALARIRRRMQKAASVPWLHREVARRMAERLLLVKARPTLIVDWQAKIGGGGQHLRTVYPEARVWALEAEDESREPVTAVTAGVLGRWQSLARRFAGRSSPLPVSDRPVPPEAGLVWANMGLHGHPDPRAVFETWLRVLAVDGFLMFSTLGPGSLPELRALYAREGWGPPMAPLVDMHDLGDLLVESGFADPVMDQEQLVLTWPDADAALRELRELGGNADPARVRGCRTPRWRTALLEALHGGAATRSDGRVGLTFEVIYGHAFKAPPRVKLAAESRVDVDQMRQMLGRRRSA